MMCCIFDGALLKSSLHFPPALQRSRLQQRLLPPARHYFLHILTTPVEVLLVLYSLSSFPDFSLSAVIYLQTNESKNEITLYLLLGDAQKKHVCKGKDGAAHCLLDVRVCLCVMFK